MAASSEKFKQYCLATSGSSSSCAMQIENFLVNMKNRGCQAWPAYLALREDLDVTCLTDSASNMSVSFYFFCVTLLAALIKWLSETIASNSILLKC